MTDAESMTPEELIRLAQEKSGGIALVQDASADAPKASPSVQHVEVDGFEVAVDVRRVTAWKTAKLVAAVQDDGLGSTERLNASIELVDFLLGDSAYSVLDHLGGDMAQTEDVIAFVSKLMEKISPKA
ncbi:MAG: hypothetical protein PUE29_10475 [Olsenella sp.]|nr:hypothetical protein [Olsenella sp.]